MKEDGKLDELFAEANALHTRSIKAGAASLHYAHQSGTALAAAKALLPHGRWQEELAGRFDGGASTDRLYRRIAEYWDDPRVRDEEGNLKVKSIRDFRTAVRVPPPCRQRWEDDDDEDRPTTGPKGKLPPTAKQYVQRKFRKMVNDLDDGNAKILAEQFTDFCYFLGERIDDPDCGRLKEKITVDMEFWTGPEMEFLLEHFDEAWGKLRGWVKSRLNKSKASNGNRNGNGKPVEVGAA